MTTSTTYSRHQLLAWTLAGAGLLFGGCVGQGSSQGPEDTTPSVDAGANEPGYDAGRQDGTAADAGAAATYPTGPYGMYEGDILKPITWTGYVDSDSDSDNDPFNEPARTVSVADYFQGLAPDSRIILINSSSGTCAICQEEMPLLVQLDAEYRSRGAHFLTALNKNNEGEPAGTDFAREWGQWFDLGFATVADPDDKLAPFYEENSQPMNMFIDSATMEIIAVHHGFDENYVRQMLDAYVD